MRRLRVRLGVICVAFILVLFINHFYLFIYFLLHTVRLEKSKPGILARIQARGRCSSRGSSPSSSPSSSPGLNPGFKNSTA